MDIESFASRLWFAKLQFSRSYTLGAYRLLTTVGEKLSETILGVVADGRSMTNAEQL